MNRLLLRWWASLESKANLWLLIILLFSLGLRLLLPASLTESEGRSRWFRVANSVATGQGYRLCWPEYYPFCGEGNDQTAAVEPVPVLIYATLIKLFYHDQTDEPAQQAILVVQSLLGLTTIVLVYKITLLLFKFPQSALLAASLWGTYIPIIVVERDLLAETIYIFFLTAGMLALLHTLQRGHTSAWLTVGLCFGLATMSRASLLYFLPIVILFIWTLSPVSIQRRLINVGLAILTFSLVLLPWSIRNFAVFNALILDNTQKGYNLYRHNHIIAGDNYLHYVELKEVENNINQRIEEGIRAGRTDIRGDEDEYEMDKIYEREAIQIIKTYPDRYLLLSLYRLWPLLTDAGVNGPLTGWGRWYGPLNIGLIILAITTVIRRRARPYLMLPVLALIGFYIASPMLVNARMRFFLQVMPYVIGLASDQMVHWVSKFITSYGSSSRPESTSPETT